MAPGPKPTLDLILLHHVSKTVIIPIFAGSELLGHLETLH